MRRLLTMSARKRVLKNSLAGASWVRCRPDPCRKTNEINLSQINKKIIFDRHFVNPIRTSTLYNKTGG